MKTGPLSAAVSGALLALSQAGVAQVVAPSPATDVVTPATATAVAPIPNPAANPPFQLS